mmetsp:Transcript_2947/g.6910  ORF Transcript_2947/g.6910 Transcript_2947/m.6910 type:complete len:256 (-) Transcript_2947:398-1165(-)
MKFCSIWLLFSKRFDISILLAARSSVLSWRKAFSISLSSSVKACCISWNCVVMYCSMRSMSSACLFRTLTYSSSLPFSSDLISAMSSSLEPMILAQEACCFLISAWRSWGTSMEKRSAHRIATAAFCRAEDSASVSSLLRSSCRRCSSAMRRWFSRSSPEALMLVTSASDLARSRRSLRRDSITCCLPLEISSLPFSSPGPSSSPERICARRSWIRCLRAWIRSCLCWFPRCSSILFLQGIRGEHFQVGFESLSS